MSGAERSALADVIGYAQANRIHYSGHAWERMRQRRISTGDVSCALRNATHCKSELGERWCVTGPDLDSEEIQVIVIIEDGVLVVTTHGA